MKLEQLLTSLRAAGEISRLRLLAVLQHNELTVTELTQVLAQSQPRVSRHLKVLSDAGLLDRFQEGSWVFYRAVRSGVYADCVNGLLAHLDRQDPACIEDFRRLEKVKEVHAKKAREYFAAQAEAWDNIRSLHVDDASVEQTVRDALGDGPIGHLLDIGTGTGRMLELFADRVDMATGIDLSHEMLAVARARLRKFGLSHCDVRQGDVYQLPVKTQSVDAVIIHHVLHFLDDPRTAIAEASRCLVDGGRIIIIDFAPHSIEFLRSKYAHRRLGFDNSQISEWLREAGASLEGSHSLDHQHGEVGETLTVNVWTGSRRAGAIRNRDVIVTDQTALMADSQASEHVGETRYATT